jgi:hypothetical protein
MYKNLTKKYSFMSIAQVENEYYFSTFFLKDRFALK